MHRVAKVVTWRRVREPSSVQSRNQHANLWPITRRKRPGRDTRTHCIFQQHSGPKNANTATDYTGVGKKTQTLMTLSNKSNMIFWSHPMILFLVPWIAVRLSLQHTWFSWDLFSKKQISQCQPGQNWWGDFLRSEIIPVSVSRKQFRYYTLEEFKRKKSTF